MSIIYDINEEKDSSIDAWNYYRKIYTVEHWPLIKMFDLENICTYEEKEKKPPKRIKRYLAYIKKEYINNEFHSRFSLGGECDFNFNNYKKKEFEKLIETASNKKKLKEQLEECHLMHYNKLNFSIMLRTGGMNNFKGQVYFEEGNIKYKKGEWHKYAFDRLDTFIYCLNEFFEGTENSLILDGSTFTNRPYLKRFLETFENIYDYCRIIYFIDEVRFVDELIKNGNKPIETVDDLKQYMDLAIKFWEIKRNNIKSILNNNILNVDKDIG